MRYIRYTFFNCNGYCLNVEALSAYLYSYYAGLAVHGALLVEDEVTDAVVDFVAAIVLNGLQRMGVVADQYIGTGIDKLMSIKALAWNGL